MEDLNLLNIPAFKRKRSISARARKKTTLGKAVSKTTQRKPARSARPRPTVEQDIHTTTDDLLRDSMLRQPLTSSRALPDFREMQSCGFCDGFFEKIDVAVVNLTKPLREGDQIIFETEEGLFEQTVKSMQIDRKDVKLARSGSDIGLKVAREPKVGGQVYKVI